MTKYIFVTGGVVSGLGKGVAAASLGRILKARGFSIFVQKFDPYLNVDPGTMSPLEHGEVYVTKDGGETDLDLGHYERFIGEEFTKDSNVTSGRILSNIIHNERKGKYNGKTVQIVPHVTEMIEEQILKAGKKSKADFIITEIGGTVGDIELYSYVYALSSFSNKYKDNSFFIHTTYVPFLEASKEFKSKPTQHSIKEIRQYGINPNLVLLRSNKQLTEEIITKVSASSQLRKDQVIGVPNSDNIYKVPLYLEENKMAQGVLKYFGLRNKKPKLDDWEEFVKLIDKKKNKKITIGMVGKYTKFEDAYMSIIEALKISSIHAGVSLELKWIKADLIKSTNVSDKLKGLDGVLILPGFGKRGFDGKVESSTFLRGTKIPTLGICYGLQAMTVSQAIKSGYKDAITTENNKSGTPIIDIVRGKSKKDILGGTLRLGEGETIIKKGTLAHKIYGKTSIFERHRHRYEVNPKYKNNIERDGFIFSGHSAKTNLAEIVEYKKHPFYIGVQYHPEFTSNPLTDHPLFSAFVRKIKSNKK